MEWNEDAIAKLRVLWDEGHSTAAIGRRLGVSKNAVVGKAHRLSLPPRPSPIRRDAVARPLAARRSVGSTLPPLVNAEPRSPTPPRPPTLPRQAVAPRLVGPRPEPARAATEPRPEPAIRVVPPRETARVGRNVECCWPLGDPGTRNFRFCDDPALPGRPYCGTHAALAYVRVRDRRDDAA